MSKPTVRQICVAGYWGEGEFLLDLSLIEVEMFALLCLEAGQ